MSARRAPPGAPAPAGFHALRFDRVVLYLILAILAARPLISEQYERLDLEFLESGGAPDGPSPATTAALDTLLLSASGVALARGGRWQRAGVLGRIAVGLLAAAAIVSTLAAEDHRLALLAGSSLCVAALAGAALRMLCEERGMRVLALAALLATGAVTALKSIRQCTDEWHATRDFWEKEYKPTLLKRGYREDDRLIINFERRMMAREAHGFVGHPNINASILAMTGVVAAGVTIAAFAAGHLGGVSVGIVLGAAAALAGWFTGSLGAAAAALAGLVVLLIAGRWAGPIAARSGMMLATFAAAYFATLGVFAAYGATRGTLPHPSLEFRWHYWTAAAKAYAEKPLTGIGRLNFAPAYLRFKAAESTEEVRDPHNLWISLLVELGPLGLAAGMLILGLLTRSALTALAPKRRRDATPTVPAERPFPPTAAALRAAPLVALLAVLHAAFSATPFSAPGMALTWAFDIVAPWAIVAVAAMIALSRVDRAEPGRPWLAAGVLAGIIVTLVHGTLDFALMTPGGLAFFALLAAATPGACGRDAQPTAAVRRRPLAAAVLLIAVAGQILFVAFPAGRSAMLDAALERELEQRAASPIPQKWRFLAADRGDTALRRRVIRATLEGLRNCPFDPNACREAFEWAESEAAQLAREQPDNSNHFALLAEVRAARADFEQTQHASAAQSRYLLDAAEALERAAELYPTNPRTRIAAGWAWLKAAGGDPSAIDRARKHFDEALRIDDLRKPEEIQRLRPAERAPVETWLRDQER